LNQLRQLVLQNKGRNQEQAGKQLEASQAATKSLVSFSRWFDLYG